jgi:hypothetical protein
MRHICRVVVLLDIPNPFQRFLRRERLLGQDRGDEHQSLPACQRRRPFVPRIQARTKQ